jgi:hypothetical protein
MSAIKLSYKNNVPIGKFESERGCTWVDPVSWFSKKVTAREGHHPITPVGFPWGSISLQYWLCRAECSIPYKTSKNNIKKIHEFIFE